MRLADAGEPDNRKSRATWTKAPLAFDTLEAAAQRGRRALSKRPDYIAKLERRGRERALVYKSLVLTGLRKGELAALTVGHVELDEPLPYLILDAADEKAGRGAEIPLRSDLADDLRRWIANLLAEAQQHARVAGKPTPARLARDTRLFTVPAGLNRIFDRDLVAAACARVSRTRSAARR